jgi:Fe-S-cluster containining protein
MTVDELRRRYLCRLPDGRWAIEVEEGSDGCPFLEGDLCSIQDVKPGQCSSYPFWDELLASKAAWNREAAHCPGIGQGPELEEEQVHKLRVLDPGSP